MRTLSILFLLPLAALADQSELVEQFFGPKGIENKGEVYAGEMLEHYLDKPTLGKRLPKDTEVSLRALEKSPNREIYAVLTSQEGESQDWYIYLVNDQSKWKISAVRRLALQSFFFMALKEIQNKSNRTKEEEYRYQNMLLTLQSDSELKAFLVKNIDSLNEIAKEVKTNHEKAIASAKKLNLKFVGYESSSGIVDVKIGGMLDNSVGYMYVPKGSEVPPMSGIEYIYIEHVTGNWHVYKTT